MAGEKYVNIRVERVIKAALDMFAADEYARTGKQLTNSQVIEKLLELGAPQNIERARQIESDATDEEDSE